MIVEITTYKRAEGVGHEELMHASREFDMNYCSRCAGLISRYVLRDGDGYMDVFIWESRSAVEHVQATFMDDPQAVAFAKLLDPNSFTMGNHEVLAAFDPGLDSRTP